ncbi:MAG: type II secretion system F family protein [Candidatus Nomurabacteria bacterium]|nr:type II secretion system F family protein [Candidatus Nomurabacteria bacterium]
MLFKYKVVDDKGINREGSIDAPNKDFAISGLQHRGFIVVSIFEEDEVKNIFNFSFLMRIPVKDVVILSRQISTLFGAQVSALKAFSLLASNTENKLLAKKLTQVADDLQSGVSISGALAKHPDVFSEFYVNMVKAGEETGKLNETFLYLADYLDRQYELTSKTKNALIYPIFVIITFFVVMGLMFVVVIPKLSAIIQDTAQTIPFYTKVVIAISDFFVNYGFIFLIFIVLMGIWVWRLSSTEAGKTYLDRLKLNTPGIGNLYKKLYLSRIADNMDTMLSSGIPIVRAIDITAEVVDSKVYKIILKDAAEGVKSGLSFSMALERHPELPSILVQMVKVGEETGGLGSILKTLATFYKREVDDAIDTLVGLIEPVMIVVLGLGVGILLVSVLVPIYNVAGSIK